MSLVIKDENGSPCMAELTIRDAAGRVTPSQIKRQAPDFFFHPQIYRKDGESLQKEALHRSQGTRRGRCRIRACEKSVPRTACGIVRDPGFGPFSANIYLGNLILSPGKSELSFHEH